MKISTKKKHHYVPVTYLKRFTDSAGFLNILRKDTFTQNRAKPSETAFRNFYYSQPLPSGAENHDALENRFSEFESRWNPIAETLANRAPANAFLQDLLAFVGFQRVRVPAFPEAVEQAMARYSNMMLKELERTGQLPEPPAELPDIVDRLVVTIDPHESIHAMVTLMGRLAPVLDSFGYCVLHNHTDTDFITSDKPVCYFQSHKSDEVVPYSWDPQKDREFIFPVSPKILLHGTSHDRDRFARRGLKHLLLKDESRVKRLNRIIAKFGYEAVFSGHALPTAFAHRFGTDSPVLDPLFQGFDPETITMPTFVFGSRHRLPKWDRAGGSKQQSF